MIRIALLIVSFVLTTICYCQVEYDTIEKGSQKVCAVDPESPHFPGGSDEMMKFFNNNISLPDSSIKTASGKVIYLKIAIDTTGNLSQISVRKGIDRSIDYEILRIFSIMPNWIPGEKNGKKISGEFVIPIKFE